MSGAGVMVRDHTARGSLEQRAFCPSCRSGGEPLIDTDGTRILTPDGAPLLVGGTGWLGTWGTQDHALAQARTHDRAHHPPRRRRHRRHTLPAVGHVVTARVEHGRLGDRDLYQPECVACSWYGPITAYPDGANTNAAMHNRAHHPLDADDASGTPSLLGGL